MTLISSKISVRALQTMRLATGAYRALAAEMPAVTRAMSAFVTTMRAVFPEGDLEPDACAHSDPEQCEYHVDIWHDLLWYGHVKSVGVTASGFTCHGVLYQLREQVARMKDLPGPESVTLVLPA